MTEGRNGKSRIALFLVAAVLSGTSVSGEKIYKYQDEKGTLFFSDRPPEGDVPVKIEQVRPEGLPQKVTLRNLGTEKRPILLAVNTYHGPAEVELLLKEEKNIVTAPALPARFVLPSGGEKELVRLRPLREGQKWTYQFAYRYVPGDPNSKHRPPGPYRPPFPPGRSFPVSQAFDGPYSHTHLQSRYAVDIPMPEGTPVHAARAGTVMEVAQDFFENGSDLNVFGERANLVRVLHEDGTMAVYGHLQLETCQVVTGSEVREGQLLAYSGNTGYSSGPHLHFAVQVNTGMELASVPFEFLGADGQPMVPQEGTVLSNPPDP